MLKDQRHTILDSTRKKVLTYFKNHKDNSSVKIAEFYGLNVKTVNRIIDAHLCKKRNHFKNQN